MTELTTAPVAAPVKEAVVKIQQNGVTRPKAGTKTARVWEIADAISAETKAPARRKAVIEKCMAEEMNAATAATQYGRWRKFNGLKGSDEPAVTEASPATAEAAPAAESDVSVDGEDEAADGEDEATE